MDGRGREEMYVGILLEILTTDLELLFILDLLRVIFGILECRSPLFFEYKLKGRVRVLSYRNVV